MKCLGKVEYTCLISGRGTAVFIAWFSDLRVSPGLPIQLRAANGQIRDTFIASVQSANQGPGKPRRPVLMLPLDIAKHEIVEGTEIWAAGE